MVKDLRLHTPKQVNPSLGTKDVPDWRNQEDRLTRSSSGRQQIGSGNTPFYKGDVVASDFLIEAKHTNKKSLSIKQEWLEKIHREAFTAEKHPALAIEFGGMPAHVPRDWILVPKHVMEQFDDSD